MPSDNIFIKREVEETTKEKMSREVKGMFLHNTF